MEVVKGHFNTLIIGILCTIFLFSLVAATNSSYCSQKKQADFDIMVTECSPSVVTSNLLAEQDVAVYCQLEAVRLNSLLQSSAVNSISFSGEYPEGVRSISYHPYRTATKTNSNVIDDVFENIGYVVVVLKQVKNESAMEDYIAGILTATINYNFVLGTKIKEESLYLGLEENSNGDFSYGSGFIKVTGYYDNSTKLSISLLGDESFASVKLNKGEMSDIFYLPGYECKAGFKIRFDDFMIPKDTVNLNINGIEYTMREGDTFLNGICSVKKIIRDCDNAAVENLPICGDIVDSSCGLYCANSPIGSVIIRCYNADYTLSLTKKANSVLQDVALTGVIKDYFENVSKFINEFEKTSYTFEKSDEKYSYFEKSLYDAIVLAKDLKMEKTEQELINMYLEKFVGSTYYYNVNQFNSQLLNINRSNAEKNLELSSGEVVDMVLNYFNFLSSDKTVTVNINYNEKSYNFSEGHTETITEGLTITAKTIFEDSAAFSINGESVSLSLGESYQYKYGENSYSSLRVSGITYRKVAKVSIIPVVDGGSVKINFSIRIPIEQRMFNLNPEMAAEKAGGMDGIINVLTKTSELLKTITQTWKGVCSATRGVMTIKMLASIANGDAIYRKAIMTTYKSMCNANVANSNKSVDECLLDYSKEIDAAVNDYSDKVKKITTDIKNAKTKDEKNYLDTVVGSYYGDDVQDDGSFSLYVDGKKYSVALKDLSNTQKEYSALWRSVSDNKGNCDDKDYVCQTIKDNIKKSFSVIIENQKTGTSHTITLFAPLFPFVGAKPNKDLVVLNEATDKEDVTDKCSNKINDPKVQYYDSSALGLSSFSEGLVAIVPFDSTNGWYVYMSAGSDYVGSKTVSSYTDAGAVKNFYICNVGKDGNIDYSIGGDSCVQFQTSNPVYSVSFGDCKPSDSEIRVLYQKALSAISQANDQYGSDSVSVLDQVIGVGNTLSQILGYECMDYLSPTDCSTLNKVCDPVECPSSKCSNIQDVTQTGIIGSIAFCLPGMGFPCVPGLYAGVDALRSMTVEYQECLRTRAETGEYTGGCDAIRSFYICELVMKNGLSGIKALLNGGLSSWIQKGINKLSGGGEYLNIFDSTKDDLAEKGNILITNLIGNSITSMFDVDVSNVSYDLCNQYLSMPTSENKEFEWTDIFSNVWNSLEPTTGASYTGVVTEEEYTDATNPPQSIYSVYYSIYAGSEGRTYKLYLKDSSYSNAATTYILTSGTIGAEETAVETLDFTADAGYKTLCIVVDGEEKCDFGVTSTLYGVNFVIDEILMAELNTTEIKTETDCLTQNTGVNLIIDLVGSGNFFDEKEMISDVGVTRICATTNPEGVDTTKVYSRWRNVGSCGYGVICWLDTNGLEDILSTINDSSRISNIAIDSAVIESKTKIDEKLNEYAKKISSEIILNVDQIKYIQGNLTEIYDLSSVSTSNQKAYAYHLLSEMYIKVARQSYIPVVEKGDENDEEEVEVTNESDGFSIVNNNVIAYNGKYSNYCLIESGENYTIKKCTGIFRTNYGRINSETGVITIGPTVKNEEIIKGVNFSELENYFYVEKTNSLHKKYAATFCSSNSDCTEDGYICNVTSGQCVEKIEEAIIEKFSISGERVITYEDEPTDYCISKETNSRIEDCRSQEFVGQIAEDGSITIELNDSIYAGYPIKNTGVSWNLLNYYKYESPSKRFSTNLFCKVKQDACSFCDKNLATCVVNMLGFCSEYEIICDFCVENPESCKEKMIDYCNLNPLTCENDWNLFCDKYPNSCTCSSDDDCGAGYFCNTTTNKCAATFCSSNSDCTEDGYICNVISGQCVEK